MKNFAWVVLLFGLSSIAGGNLNIDDSRLMALILVVPTMYLFLKEIPN